MCSRFELNSPAREIAARFGLRMPPPILPGLVVRPTDPALVLTKAGPDLRRFGMAVAWSGRPVINARAETVAQKSTFAPLLAARCIVPASDWIEWQDAGPGRKKPMWRLHAGDQPLFALAGLVSGAEFLLLTCAAAPAIVALHDRMPVVLAPEAEQAWLDPAKSFSEVAGLLVPYGGALVARPADAPMPGLFGSLPP